VIDCGDGVARQMMIGGRVPDAQARLHHAPSFGSQRRLRQPAAARVGRRVDDAG
jgi:hypothetical protein